MHSECTPLHETRVTQVLGVCRTCRDSELARMFPVCQGGNGKEGK